MKVMLSIRGIVIRRIATLSMMAVLVSAAQTPPAPGPTPAPGKTTAPVSVEDIIKALDTSARPDSAIGGKVPASIDAAPASGQAAGQATPAPVIVPVTPPAITPAGPKVIEDPAGTNGTAGPNQLPSALPSRATSGIKQAKPYIIGPLDVLEVKVWNEQKLSGIFDVGADGMISMPLVGTVEANGLTGPELTASIKQRLAQIIIEPEVNVQVLRNNSKKYSIFGGCLRQGEFPLLGEVTVLDAFANCGGFRDFANLKKVYILRGDKQIKFNYKDAIRGRHLEQNILLQNGDRIVIPE